MASQIAVFKPSPVVTTMTPTNRDNFVVIEHSVYGDDAGKYIVTYHNGWDEANKYASKINKTKGVDVVVAEVQTHYITPRH